MFQNISGFAYYRASVMTADSLVLVRTGRVVELHLRSGVGQSIRSIVLRRRD